MASETKCECGHARADHYGYTGGKFACVANQLTCPCDDFRAAPSTPAQGREEDVERAAEIIRDGLVQDRPTRNIARDVLSLRARPLPADVQSLLATLEREALALDQLVADVRREGGDQPDRLRAYSFAEGVELLRTALRAAPAEAEGEEAGR